MAGDPTITAEPESLSGARWLARMLTERVCRSFGILPVAVTDDVVAVAVIDVNEPLVIDVARNLLGHEVELRQFSQAEMERGFAVIFAEDPTEEAPEATPHSTNGNGNGNGNGAHPSHGSGDRPPELTVLAAAAAQAGSAHEAPDDNQPEPVPGPVTPGIGQAAEQPVPEVEASVPQTAPDPGFPVWQRLAVIPAVAAIVVAFLLSAKTTATALLTVVAVLYLSFALAQVRRLVRSRHSASSTRSSIPEFAGAPAVAPASVPIAAPVIAEDGAPSSVASALEPPGQTTDVDVDEPVVAARPRPSIAELTRQVESAMDDAGSDQRRRPSHEQTALAVAAGILRDAEAEGRRTIDLALVQRDALLETARTKAESLITEAYGEVHKLVSDSQAGNAGHIPVAAEEALVAPAVDIGAAEAKLPQVEELNRRIRRIAALTEQLTDVAERAGGASAPATDAFAVKSMRAGDPLSELAAELHRRVALTHR